MNAITPTPPGSGRHANGFASKAVECPACGETMKDTGKRETSRITGNPMKIMGCPNCGNETGVSRAGTEGGG